MDVSKMKNMVILKNLPSNIVDEAYVVLKSNKKVKKLEKIEKAKQSMSEKEGKKDKEYMLKEAEMLIKDCILKLENKPKSNNQINKSTRRVKIWASLVTIVAALEGLIIISS